MCIAAVAVYLYHPSVPVLVRGFSVALAIIISADLLRFKYPAFEKFYEGVLGYFMREEERGKQCALYEANYGLISRMII